MPCLSYNNIESIVSHAHFIITGFKLGEDYPKAYNSLASKFAKDGENFGSCPNGSFGLGVGGL